MISFFYPAKTFRRFLLACAPILVGACGAEGDVDSDALGDGLVAKSAEALIIKAPNDHDSLKGDLVNIIPGDYNSDGWTDFIRQEKGAWDNDAIRTAETWLSNGDGTFSIFTPTDYNSLKGDLVNIIPGDYNSDGSTDFIRQEKGAWDDDAIRTAEVWLSDDHGDFFPTTPNDYNSLKGDLVNIIPGDFNGDGRTDFIRQEKGAWDDDAIRTAELWRSNGNGTFIVITPIDYNSLKGDLTNIIPLNYNGDSRTDFIRQEKGAWDDDAIRTAEVWRSNANGTFTIFTPNDYNSLKGDLVNIIPGDYDGDGRGDFIRQEKGAWDDDAIRTCEVWFSNGNATFTVVLPNDYDSLKGDLTKLIPGDYNGDGRTDFVRQEKNGWDDNAVRTAEIWLSNGDGTFDITLPYGYDALKGDLTNLIPGDYNGDYKDDFIRQEKGGWDDDAIRTCEVWFAL